MTATPGSISDISRSMQQETSRDAKAHTCALVMLARRDCTRLAIRPHMHMSHPWATHLEFSWVLVLVAALTDLQLQQIPSLYDVLITPNLDRYTCQRILCRFVFHNFSLCVYLYMWKDAGVYAPLMSTWRVIRQLDPSVYAQLLGSEYMYEKHLRAAHLMLEDMMHFWYFVNKYKKSQQRVFEAWVHIRYASARAAS